MPATRDGTGAIARYPDPAIEILDAKRFGPFRLGNAAVERLWTGARWTEGPVYFGDARCLLFSDIPNNRIMRWDEDTGRVSVYRQPSNYSNGHTRDRQGRLVSCEHYSRRVTRTEYDGSITVLLDSFEGKKLNAPNDVVVRADDSVWFTDPGYGIHCFAPDGDLIGRIHLPETASNLCFGGEKKNRLFITGSQSIYAVYLETVGAQWP